MASVGDYKKNVEDTVKYTGDTFLIVDTLVEYVKGEKKGSFTMERAIRSPGTRIIIEKDGKLLLGKEFRAEVNGWDYRLLGGKVFNSLSAYLEHRDNEEAMNQKTLEAITHEAEEEAGVIVKQAKLLEHSLSSTPTLVWDLYYFKITEFELAKGGQNLEEWELIDLGWYDFEEVKKMCLEGKIQEDRTVAVLLKYLLSRE